ncbi:MAG: hypothetical protein D9V47_13800 [Clostridia bacterium]|nr:MAG: hypothetical protein D9V47_13800 [Clostridia bacterium]
MPTQCTAKSKHTGQQCRAYAVNGTDKCRVHGGMTPIKHGLYSKYTKAKLGALIAELRDNPALTDIKEHVAFMFALLIKKLEAMQERFTDEDISHLTTLSEKITKAIERWHKVAFGEKYILQIEEIQTLINQIVVIIRQEVHDPATVERLAKRLQEVRW